MKLNKIHNKGSLKRLLKRFNNGNKLSYIDGDWKIAVGGYDLWFEIYLKDIPIVKCIEGKLSTCQEVGKKYLDIVKECLPYTVKKTL